MNTEIVKGDLSGCYPIINKQFTIGDKTLDIRERQMWAYQKKERYFLYNEADKEYISSICKVKYGGVIINTIDYKGNYYLIDMEDEDKVYIQFLNKKRSRKAKKK